MNKVVKVMLGVTGVVAAGFGIALGVEHYRNKKFEKKLDNIDNNGVEALVINYAELCDTVPIRFLEGLDEMKEDLFFEVGELIFNAYDANEEMLHMESAEDEERIVLFFNGDRLTWKSGDCL